MASFKGALLAVALAATSLAAGLLAEPANAAPGRTAACLNRMSGEGTGMGTGGVGTQNARSTAAVDWSRKVAAQHGPRFADFAKARSVRYDCRNGFVLEVKCALSAQPCR